MAAYKAWTRVPLTELAALPLPSRLRLGAVFYALFFDMTLPITNQAVNSGKNIRQPLSLVALFRFMRLFRARGW